VVDFLRNHARETWACDFLQAYDVFFRPIFALVFIELATRKVVLAATTRFPRLDDRHFHRVVTEYVRYHNDARPHQGIRQRTPVHAARPAKGKITTLAVLVGLHHEYRRAA
jgi:hypothetical protein